MICKDSNKKLAKYLRVNPPLARPQMLVSDMIDNLFLAYNSARLRQGVRLIVEKMLPDDGYVGMSLAGALTPAGLGKSCIIPMIKAGFIDWIVATGANLYHDLHFGLNLSLHAGSPFLDDVELRQAGIVRIYDILFDYEVLLDTDAFIRKIIQNEEFQRTMATDEFHYLLGKHVFELEKQLGIETSSILSAAYQYAVPIFTSSPGDSSIGMNISAMALRGSKLQIDIARDVNQTAAIVYNAKVSRKKSSVILIGGGSPKNFVMQTEPQIQEVLGIPEEGHDYFFQCTDARPDTGGLSGATPSEAVSWGKVNPNNLPDCVVAYIDATVALPLITCYCLDRHNPRPHKRLYLIRDQMLENLREGYMRYGSIEKLKRPKRKACDPMAKSCKK